MITSVRLVNYKGFRNFHLKMDGDAVLVGANNAGKSSVLSALRLVAALIPLGRRLNTSTTGVTRGRVERAWPITQAALDNASFNGDNVRYDFRSNETRVDVQFDSGAHVVVVWPEQSTLDSDDDPPFFFVSPPSGFTGTARSCMRDLIDDMSIVPTLSPVDDRETLVTDETLRRNLLGRRASRYVRNALLRIEEDRESWSEFLQFVLDHTPEIKSLEISQRDDELDLFYVDADGTRVREITWAGDGIQIWIQVLYFYWRERSASILVLDEPDVYLHPDLQRRMARLVMGRGGQTILATHSVEVLSEADADTAVWIDRTRPRAERMSQANSLSQFGRRLGSSFELGLARALRSGLALFVEGQDLQLISLLAETVGTARVARRVDFSTIPLGGFTRHWVASGFSEVISVLGSTVTSAVLLDGDLRSIESRERVRQIVAAEGVDLHIWARREIENYVVAPSSVSNCSGLSEAECVWLIDQVASELKEEALSSLQAQRMSERRELGASTSGHSDLTILQNARTEFDLLWGTFDSRLKVVDAKRLISGLNVLLRERRARSLSAQKLARNLPLIDVADEVASYFHHLEYIMEEAAAQSLSL